MVSIKFTATGNSDLELTDPAVIVAGYTGRNEAAVQQHIDELAKIGIPPPATVPSFYAMPQSSLTDADVITVNGSFTSGEVEPVLVRAAGTLYLGVGSDHTDRDLERSSIELSKTVCPKPVGARVALLPKEFDWDDIRIRSWVDGTLYQDGTLGELRIPTSLIDLSDLPESRDFVMFCGTVPLIEGTFTAGREWSLELSVPGWDPLTHNYRVIHAAA